MSSALLFWEISGKEVWQHSKSLISALKEKKKTWKKFENMEYI